MTRKEKVFYIAMLSNVIRFDSIKYLSIDSFSSW